MKCGGRFQEIRKPEILLMRVSAIQQALREVADSLAARNTLRDQLNAQQALVNPLDEYYQLAKNRYDAGITSYLDLLPSSFSVFSLVMFITNPDTVLDPSIGHQVE